MAVRGEMPVDSTSAGLDHRRRACRLNVPIEELGVELLRARDILAPDLKMYYWLSHISSFNDPSPQVPHNRDITTGCQHPRLKCNYLRLGRYTSLGSLKHSWNLTAV